MLKFKKGDTVTQAVTPISGTVSRIIVVDDDEVQYMVAYTGADGEQHERPFKEDEIEAVKAAEPEAAA